MHAIPLPGLVDPHDLSADRQFAMNLARGMEVLRAFTATTPLLGNREISDRTGLPKPTVSRLTYTLTLLGYLSRDARLQKYRLGPGVLSLGHPLLASMQVRQLAKPFMESLARTTGCTVNLGVRDRDQLVYIDSVRRGRTRRQFGQAIGEFQLVQQLIADSNTARKRDAGQDVIMEASMCKLFASEMCGRVADRAVQLFGGSGYIADNVAERFYRDVRLFRLYEGTSQIHVTNIAKRSMAALAE
ncbi:acyl-CoA dehydrogenase family protein [Comamonas composti]|uniref:acyl-CoA dehydrogenase family protein n=1 Tax=Comamonas composti TaxID=408558 RepID=UPI000A029818